jgi:hypothetical protein
MIVRHYNRQGRVREYNFASLPVAEPLQRSLAVLFAARCTPGRWSTHATSETHWVHLRQFAESLAREQRPPGDLDELTQRMVRRWRDGLPLASGYNSFRTIGGMLREDARLHEGPVADELARYYKRSGSTIQSYTGTEFDRVTVTARRQFRAALLRIRENSVYLQKWREGAFAVGSRDWVIGDGLDILARTGDLPRYDDKNGGRTVKNPYRNAFREAGPATWQRLFLTREEAVALGVLLLAEYGWNLSVINRVEVPRASPDQGEDGHPTYRILLQKPRRGSGRFYETRNVTDEGAASPGRLITQALEATRFARTIVEELAPGLDRLIVWRAVMPRRRWSDMDGHPPVGPFRFGISKEDAHSWAKTEGLDGSPFQRGRRTVIAFDRREPGQHSQETHDRHYVLPDERARVRAVEVIAAGAEDAAERARRAVLGADLRGQPVPGDAETATADCSGYHNSPYPSPDGGCAASFLMCLACPNARIHPGHHPRLAHLHEALDSLRSVLPRGAWSADWRDPYERLEDLRDRLGAGPWAQALDKVTDADRELISHLLTGALDS